MRPVLLELPFPSGTVLLGWPLAALAALGLFLVALGLRERTRSLTLPGAALALTSTLLAFRLRNQGVELGPIALYSYGTALALAIAAGWVLTLSGAQRAGTRLDATSTVYVAGVVGGVGGARLLYLLLHREDYTTLGDALAVDQGGLALYGGAAGAALASSWACRRYRMAWLHWADLATPAFAAAILVGRLGCYLFGCDYGRPLPASAPVWIARLGTFPRWTGSVGERGTGAPAWLDHVASGRVPMESTASAPVHPTQLYEASVAGLLLALALFLRRRQHRAGDTFLSVAFGYAAARFALEFLRGDPERGLVGPVLEARWTLAAGVIIFTAGFAVGPARRLLRGRAARVTATSMAAGLGLCGLFVVSGRATISSAQWLGVLSACGIAVVWHRQHRHSVSPATGQRGADPDATSA